MSNSIISICNSALFKIGCERISSLNEENKRARACKEQYEKVRDDVLRARNWKFATKRASLSMLGTKPAFGYANEFALPADYMRLCDVLNNVEVSIEDNKLLTNNNTISISYIYKCEDVYKYDASFVEALALKLAAELAYPMVQSNTTADRLFNQYKKIVEAEAAFHSSNESNKIMNDTDDVWLRARYGAVSYDVE